MSLLIPICCISQNIYPQRLNDSLIVITNLQLKQSNLIFTEHRFLKEKVNLLEIQLDNYSNLTNELSIKDSLNNEKYESLVKLSNNQVYSLNNEINRLKSKRVEKNICIGCLSISVAGLLIYSLLK